MNAVSNQPQLFAAARAMIGSGLRWCMLACCLGSLLSCSTLRVGYDNADTVAVWWLDRYLDLTPVQKTLLRRDAAQLLQWHRKTQLPLYVQFLQQMQGQLKGRVTRAELEADSDRIEQLAQAILLQAVPQLSDLVLSLNEAQLAHLEKRFNSQNEEYRKEFIIDAAPKRERRRIKKVMRQAHDWLGSFSPEQEEKIHALVKAQPRNNQLWLDERIARQQKILTVLRQLQRDKPAREVAQESMRKLVLALFEHTSQQQRRAYFDAWHESTVLLIDAAVHDATPAQKAFAGKRLQGWIDDYTKLMAQKR